MENKLLKYVTKMIWSNDDQVKSIANDKKENFESYMSNHKEFYINVKDVSDIDFDAIVNGFRSYMGNKNTRNILDICQRIN